MKNRRLLLALVAAIIALQAGARPRTKEEMRDIAARHLSRTAPVKGIKARAADAPPVCVAEAAAYTIFNDAGGCGFAIVSACEGVRPVIGYGPGRFDADNVPCGLQWWLAKAAAHLPDAAHRSSEGDEAATGTPINPMLTTKWGQDAPYNLLTPTIGDAHAPTGCVATALAQILNYNQYPAAASFTASYSVGEEAEARSEQVASTYSYPYQTAYGYYLPTGDLDLSEAAYMDFTAADARDIATLMRDCGFASGMAYSETGSGTATILAAMGALEAFRYPAEAVKTYTRAYYSAAEWRGLIDAELERGCPILYGGADTDFGGHAFVLHGRDAEGRAYINWGWDGIDDGYYDLDVLNPPGFSFSDSQVMVTGLRPQPLEDDREMSLFTTEEPYKIKVVRSRLAVDFVKSLFNRAPTTFSGRVCLVVEDMATGKVTRSILINTDSPVRPYYGIYDGLKQTTIAPAKGAHCRIYVASKGTNEAEWQPVRTAGGPIYYEMTVNAAGQATFSEPAYFATRITDIAAATPSDDALTRVYDLQGRLRHTAPAAQFNLRDVPFSGIVLIKSGHKVQKVVR